MNIIQAKGEGQGQCILCMSRGKWNVHWMVFLYRIEGKEGLYCSNCVNELKKGNNKEVFK